MLCQFMGKFKIIVKTNSKNDSVEKIDDFFKVCVKAKPVQGNANLYIIKFLTKYFGKRVRISKGFKSKEKILEFID